ncbi:hypothetical protein JCM11641_007464 [Rhodosporidiobolus odoratus]
MLSDSIFSRLLIKSGILALDAVAPLSLLYLVLSLVCAPVPAAIILTTSLPVPEAVDLLLALDKPLQLITVYCLAESVWWVISLLSRTLLDRRWWDFRGDPDDPTSSEERWRLWRSMVESAQDPWEWLQGFFLAPGYRRAARGAEDPALRKVRPEQVGRTNVEEFIAHFMFSARLRDLKKQGPKSLDLAEMHSMILLLEAQMTLSRPSSTQPFRFLRGRSPHRVFQIAQEPLSFGHHPLVFYPATFGASQACNLALYLGGFRYYGSRSPSRFLPRFLRSSRRSLESVLDPVEAEKMGDARLAEKVGYWYKPARQDRLEEDARPLLMCHGISGLFVATPFLLGLSWLSGRAMFIPELPYLSMRLSPPSSILTRLEYVAAVRRMLWAHGFGLTSLDPTEDDESFVVGEDDEDWRRAKCIVVAHSFGSGAAGWLLRDAPDLVAGTVLIDPMSFLLFSADTPRNFFRTKCSTAGEIFFRYFALERGINHFLSRHLRWSDSVLFGPKAAAPLPPHVIGTLVPRCAKTELDPESDVPFYAPVVDPVGEGPLPTIIFLAEKDCILPVPNIRQYLLSTGFSTSLPPPPYSEKSLTTTTGPGSLTSSPSLAEGSAETVPSLRIMPKMEHGAVLGRWKWWREVAKAVEAVAVAAERWEKGEEE